MLSLNLYDPTHYLSLELSLMFLKIVAVIIISLFSYRAYKITKEKKHLTFSLAFIAILFAFIIKIVSYYFFLKNMLCLGCIGYESFFLFYFLYILLYILGSGMLVLIYSEQNDIVSLTFLGVLLFIISTMSIKSFTLFSGFEGLIFGFITLKIIEKYNITKNKNTIMSIVGFGLLSLAHFMKAYYFHSPYIYITGELLNIIGYVIISIVVFRIFNK